MAPFGKCVYSKLFPDSSSVRCQVSPGVPNCDGLEERYPDNRRNREAAQSAASPLFPTLEAGKPCRS